MSPPEPSWLPAGRELILPGRGTTFVRDMAGPPGAPTVLLLHGLGATADLNWFTTYGPLGRGYRVIAMDHRGHGRGVRSMRPFRLQDCADDAAAVIDVLGLDPVVAVGYSMGGPVAQLLWRRHPRVVRGLVLCATARRFAQAGPGQRLFSSGVLGASLAAKLAPASLRNRLTAQLLQGRFADDPVSAWAADEVRRSDPGSLMQALGALMAYDARPWLGEIDVPAAVVLTEEDTAVSPSSQAALARSIPGCTVHRVRGGHGVCVSDPARFIPVLRSAVADVVARTPLSAGRS